MLPPLRTGCLCDCKEQMFSVLNNPQVTGKTKHYTLCVISLGDWVFIGVLCVCTSVLISKGYFGIHTISFTIQHKSNYVLIFMIASGIRKYAPNYIAQHTKHYNSRNVYIFLMRLQLHSRREI